MKGTVIPDVVDALGTLPKRLIKGLEDLLIRGQVEAIKTTTLSRLARTLRVLKSGLCIYHYYNHYYLLLESFIHQRYLMVIQWSLSDSKSPLVSRTLLSIMSVTWLLAILISFPLKLLLLLIFNFSFSYDYCFSILFICCRF